jgi:Rrf2 family protein
LAHLQTEGKSPSTCATTKRTLALLVSHLGTERDVGGVVAPKLEWFFASEVATKQQGKPRAPASTEQGVSAAHLSKVMQQLVKVGLLTSRRGPGGGFILGREAKSISLLELLDALDGPMSDNKCMLGRKKCLYGGCALGAQLTHVNFVRWGDVVVAQYLRRPRNE